MKLQYRKTKNGSAESIARVRASVKKMHPAYEWVERRCLCCRRDFYSEGKHNHICGKCKESANYKTT